jgi:hypothetical protein
MAMCGQHATSHYDHKAANTAARKRHGSNHKSYVRHGAAHSATSPQRARHARVGGASLARRQRSTPPAPAPAAGAPSRPRSGPAHRHTARPRAHHACTRAAAQPTAATRRRAGCTDDCGCGIGAPWDPRRCPSLVQWRHGASIWRHGASITDAPPSAPTPPAARRRAAAAPAAGAQC